jgi:hypothetical protein
VKGGDTQPPQPSRGLPRYGIVAPRLATSMTWKCLVPDLGDAGLGLSTAIVVFISGCDMFDCLRTNKGSKLCRDNVQLICASSQGQIHCSVALQEKTR